MVFFIDDVDVVDRFQLFGLTGDLLLRFGHREIFGNVAELRRHHGAGGAFRIGAEALDVAPLDRGDQRHQLLDDRQADLRQQVDAVVRRQVADELGDLGPIDRLDDFDLPLLLEEPEDLDAQRHLGMLQDRPGLGGRQPLHELGSPRRMQRGAEFLQLGHVVLGQHFAEFGQVERVRHDGTSVASPGWLPGSMSIFGWSSAWGQPSRHGRGQVHVFGRRISRKTSLLAEKWTSPQRAHQQSDQGDGSGRRSVQADEFQRQHHQDHTAGQSPEVRQRLDDDHRPGAASKIRCTC